MGRVLLLTVFLSFMSLFIGWKATNISYKRKLELADWNTLYECPSCGKLHRKYQQELVRKLDPSFRTPFTCPYCHSACHLYTGSVYPWMKAGPHFPEISGRDLRRLKKTLRKVDRINLENESLEKFLQYSQFPPFSKK